MCRTKALTGILILGLALSLALGLNYLSSHREEPQCFQTVQQVVIRNVTEPVDCVQLLTKQAESLEYLRWKLNVTDG